MASLLNHARISRRTFYNMGGFANPLCVRVTRNGAWAYYWRAD